MAARGRRSCSHPVPFRCDSQLAQLVRAPHTLAVHHGCSSVSGGGGSVVRQTAGARTSSHLQLGPYSTSQLLACRGVAQGTCSVRVGVPARARKPSAALRGGAAARQWQQRQRQLGGSGGGGGTASPAAVFPLAPTGSQGTAIGRKWACGAPVSEHSVNRPRGAPACGGPAPPYLELAPHGP